MQRVGPPLTPSGCKGKALIRSLRVRYVSNVTDDGIEEILPFPAVNDCICVVKYGGYYSSISCSGTKLEIDLVIRRKKRMSVLEKIL